MNKADRDLVARLIVSAHRVLPHPSQHDLFGVVVTWLLNNLPAIRADDDRLLWDIQHFRPELGVNLDDHIIYCLKRHGRSVEEAAEELEATRRRYHRFRETWHQVAEEDLEEVLRDVFRHIYPPPPIGAADEWRRQLYDERELRDWYV